MSGTQDTNWKSFVGPQDNNRLIRSTDWLAPEFPRDWDDLFKCSNVAGLEVVGLTIPASREDSVDCVRVAALGADAYGAVQEVLYLTR